MSRVGGYGGNIGILGGASRPAFGVIRYNPFFRRLDEEQEKKESELRKFKEDIKSW